jgi:hypothetical protein
MTARLKPGPFKAVNRETSPVNFQRLVWLQRVVRPLRPFLR